MSRNTKRQTMEPLIVSETDSTPYMKFDNHTGIFEISGSSMPEDVVKVYDCVFVWLKEYTLSPQPQTIMNMNLKYFNSATAKIILSLMHSLEQILKKGKEVMVNWCYIANDEESFEAGEDYASMVIIPFKFVKID
jgi:hypothetical protein